MATILAINDGNWNEPSIWDSGTVPTIDDVVYLNGHTVTANVNIDLGTNGEIRNDEEQGVGAVAGGYIEHTVSGRTIIANLFIYDTFIIRATNAAPNTTIVGNVIVIGGAQGIMSSSANNSAATISVTGNIHLGSACFCNRIRLGFTIVGDIYAEHGYMQNITPAYTYTRRVTGDIYLGDSAISLFSASSNTENPFSVAGNIVGSSQTLVGGGNEQTSLSNPVSISGDVVLNNSTLFSHGVTHFNMNGTLTQGQGQIASYITTMNLDGTLNLSGTRPFTYGVQNLNVATGGQVTYDNHLYYCFTNIVAVDSNFTITCRNQNLDNFDFKNKNLLNNTYPAQANVSDGYVYGLEDQFTGSYQLPPESVVLEGTPYGSHVGTLTLDISSSVQDTIDDMEDEVNTLLDSYPPLVQTLSASDLNTTSATINLSTSNVGVTTTKTGVELDTNWQFSNPISNEVNNVVNQVSISGLTAGTNYYARAYVVDNGNNVYSSNIIPVSTLLIPSELQLCEYLQTDGNCWINIRQDEFPLNNYSLEVKYKTVNGNEQSIWGCMNGSSMYFRSIFTGANNSTIRVSYGNTNAAFGGDNRNTAYQEAIHYLKNNTLKITNWAGTVLRNQTATMSSLTAKNLTLFGVYNITNDTVTAMLSGGRIVSSNFTTFDQISRIVSTYIKSGETYVDNKGNTCSAGTCGFYDIVNGTFYTNDGGGNFTHGNDII